MPPRPSVTAAGQLPSSFSTFLIPMALTHTKIITRPRLLMQTKPSLSQTFSLALSLRINVVRCCVIHGRRNWMRHIWGTENLGPFELISVKRTYTSRPYLLSSKTHFFSATGLTIKHSINSFSSFTPSIPSSETTNLSTSSNQ